MLPGEFGTLDEALEISTLIQTGKLTKFPVVALGTEFWEPMRGFLHGAVSEQNLINESDLDIVKLTNDVEEAVSWIKAGLR